MKENPFSHKYIKVGVKIDLIVKEGTKAGQMMEMGDIVQTIMQDKIIEAIDSEETSEDTVDKIVEKIRGMKSIVSNNRDRNRSRERVLTRSYGNGRDRSSSNDRSRSGSRASTKRVRIRCYTCREYDHFVRDCPNSREERDLQQLQHMLNMEEQDHRSLSSPGSDEDSQKSFKLMNGRDDATTFLPLDSRIDGQSGDSHPPVGQYLSRAQTKYVYKKVEMGEMINVDTIQQEIEQEKQLNTMDDGNGGINPYRELIVNNAEKSRITNDPDGAVVNTK